MLLFSGWIDAIDAIDAIADMGFWGCGLGGMEENKKSGGGDVRAASHPTHIPRRPKKKTAADAKNGASCVSRVAWPYLWILATTDHLEAQRYGFAISKLRFRLRLRLHGDWQ